MANTIYDRYLEAEVLSADPVKLVWLLYRGALDAAGAARRDLAAGDIRGRTRQINRAWGILRELAATLDHAKGGEISRRLAGLYSYMQGRLVEANVKQDAQPLEEVISLLTTLAGAWETPSHPISAQSPGAPHQPCSGYVEHDQDADCEPIALAVA